MASFSRTWLAGVLGFGFLVPAFGIIPTPQFIEPAKDSLDIPHAAQILVVINGASERAIEKSKLAAEFLKQDLLQADSTLQIEVRTQSTPAPEGVSIHFWDFSANSRLPVHLNLLDTETLNPRAHYGQSYVIKTPDARNLWVVGSTDEGVLLGTMSILQLIHKTATGAEISGAYIRDYPDFQFRDAANWLMNGEGTRWSMDRGHGIEGYKRTCERKMDAALRFKINMITFDGFGWGLEQRFQGYSKMMRSLNAYARARGIHLIFGGYGAGYGMAYQTGPLYEAAPYLGKIFENRVSYPDGSIYQCMGFPRSKAGVDPSTLGTCRANEELNHLKAEELGNYVEAVEPGALYIHHEDLGGYRATEEMWQKRCERCRRRWPNNALCAKDGGAGAFANGYSSLVRAVEGVKDPATGYDAARDCQIILVSPVYDADSSASDDWSNVLQLWANIARQLPSAGNIQVCFREVFSQPGGGETWIHTFNSTMADAGLHLGTYMFFAGGADNYSTSNTLTGAPVLDGEFQGATSIFNFNGNFFQEPMAVINAEYAWNAHPRGMAHPPAQGEEVTELWRRYMFVPDEPAELFGPGGVYEAACKLLYGSQAAPAMASYYRESAWVPDYGTRFRPGANYLPMLPPTFDRAYAIPEHWRDLALDSKTWGVKLRNATYAAEFARLRIDRRELHRRLAHRWSVMASLNAQGARDVEEALRSNPRPGSVQDLQFLATILQVDRVLIDALVDFHNGMERYFASPQDANEARARFRRALSEAKQAQTRAAEAFPEPIDPTGGEVGTIRTDTVGLVDAITAMIRLIS